MYRKKTHIKLQKKHITCYTRLTNDNDNTVKIEKENGNKHLY